MKYIDLDKKRFTHPVTGIVYECYVTDYIGGRNFLNIRGEYNGMPFDCLDIKRMQRTTFLKEYGLVSSNVTGDFPEFEKTEDIIKLCNILNDLLTEKYEGVKSNTNTIILEFE